MLPRSTYRKLTVLCFALFVAIFTVTAQTNPIKEENALPGNPPSEWDIPATKAGDTSLQGFATNLSVNKGETVYFKIKSLVSNFTIKVYRIGYYGGNGARYIADGVVTDGVAATTQPAPAEDPSVGLVDCGNWSVVGHFDVPANAVSGVYIARLKRDDIAQQDSASHIVFIVRDDASTSDLLFQTSDATWQAYNYYGGGSLYVGNFFGHAAKVSYNRPFLTRAGGGGGGAGQDWLFHSEYPMIRFLEKNGYDMSYVTNLDMARMPTNPILQHKTFLSVGHDEYWSKEMRDKVEAARDAGKNLAFFSGNEIYWKVRWENSIDGAGTPYSTLVCYKEGTQGEMICEGDCDPDPTTWTGLWRTGEHLDAGKPENALSGQISWKGSEDAIKVPYAYKDLRFWKNTSVADLTPGNQVVLPYGTLGYEWNFEQYFDFFPRGRFTLSRTKVGELIHKISIYKAPSGALIFGAGTVQWSWGLDENHDLTDGEPPNRDMQQATINLLADMGALPTSRQGDLAEPIPTTDVTKPHSVIAFPILNSSIPKGFEVVVSGTATDVDGAVAGVEISVDGGNTWRVAEGTTNWTFAWTPTLAGSYTIKTRGIDDSGNMEDDPTTNGDNHIEITVLDNLLITANTPLNLSNKLAQNTTVTATFDQVIDGTTVNATTFQLKDANNNTVAASYNTTGNKITVTPSAQLTRSATYTVLVKGGVSGLQSTTGNNLIADSSWIFTVVDPAPIAPSEGHGGPILVVSAAGNPFSRYAVEILRAEGLNSFAAQDISTVDAGVLTNYDVVVLGEMPINGPQATMFSDWVNAGGTLISFKPANSLATLMGITKAGGSLSDRYILINTASGPGVGIVGETIQYHGAAEEYSLNGATSIAALYSNASTATAYHAITSINVGSNGGRAIAFAYDLSKSIVYTRQGNPAWAGTERDGLSPIRSDDMFYSADGQHWIDFNKVAIPQADEQQRLLANMIIQGNLHRKPLPKFWYLPKQLKAAVVMTGDDHANNGTEGRFNHYQAKGPNTTQDFLNWNTVRGSSYMYPTTPISREKVIQLESMGFEIALHTTTECADFTPISLDNAFTSEIQVFRDSFPEIPSPVTNRTHCMVWSDWATHAKVELAKGIRYDVNYYNWPNNGIWLPNTPGLFTGSGFPMRFADQDGSLLDIYQSPTQMTDETEMNISSFATAVLDKAVGAEGYYSVITANMHTDNITHTGSEAIIDLAQARGIPVISAKQMLTWLDGRNNSSFQNITWTGNQLIFNVATISGTNNLKAMLPFNSGLSDLTSVTRNGNAVSFSTETIKGINYAFFDAAAGVYIATYGAVTTGTITGSVTLQGRPAAPHAQWIVPVTVSLYLTGNPTAIATFNTTTDANGQFIVTGVPVGTYNIGVKNSHTQARLLLDQTVVVGGNSMNFGILNEGDVTNDNFVTAFDLGALLSSYNKAAGDPGFNANADLNNDGFVTAIDLGLLLGNYNTAGETNP